MNHHIHTNQLIHETSPYLLQHAHNPVNWHPWNREAIQKAKDEDKPIFLSIGYSACHWCHVMERESFENVRIAEILNTRFISIKVDREERPDLDDYYMQAVQIMTGRGGWPLSLFLTLDLEPFYGGTYFPPEDKYHMPGFAKILLTVHESWLKNNNTVTRSAEQIRHYLKTSNDFEVTDNEIKNHLNNTVFQQIVGSFDSENGGFSQAPKFPQPILLNTLFHYHHKTNDKQALSMITRTLDKMADGGIFDHLGGGFHRYSVDTSWLVPHFEKMLYDNALLAMVYLHAFQITKNEKYAKTAREILDYVLREMTHPMGGFYSTQDADSEGEEGKYYVWTKKELDDLLTKEEAKLFYALYDCPTQGNWEDKIILRRKSDEKSLIKQIDLSEPQFRERLKKIHQTLIQIREQREPPGKDDKILTDWNGLMISAFCLGANILGDKQYRKAAENTAEFILENLYDGQNLYHSFRKHRSDVKGFLRDYAFFTEGLIDLYECTFNPEWIQKARQFADKTLSLFYDKKRGGFYTTSESHEDLPLRRKNPLESSLPSGDAVAVRNMIRLTAFWDHLDYLEPIQNTLKLHQRTRQKFISAGIQLALSPSQI
jgi:uncharacterized protein YyaL (SSP411 family)